MYKSEDLKEIEYLNMDWIHAGQDRNWQLDLANAVVNRDLFSERRNSYVIATSKA